MGEMTGKVLLVTGASSGIGRATALRFGSQGADVVLVARRADRLAAVAEALEAAGSRAMSIAVDLTDETGPERIVREAVDALGGIDVLVNAAGVIGMGTIETTSIHEWDRMMAVNARVPFMLMQHALPSLIERRGAIVNVSSVNGLRAFPGVLAYCVSKAAVDQLTHCAALELAAKGVRVNAVNPGVTITELHRAGGMDEEAYARFLEHSKTTHPLGRVGRPEEVADLIYFLASPQAGWITGVSVPIDGGRHQTCAR